MVPSRPLSFRWRYDLATTLRWFFAMANEGAHKHNPC